MFSIKCGGPTKSEWSPGFQFFLPSFPIIALLWQEWPYKEKKKVLILQECNNMHINNFGGLEYVIVELSGQ